MLLDPPDLSYPKAHQSRRPGALLAQPKAGSRAEKLFVPQLGSSSGAESPLSFPTETSAKICGTGSLRSSSPCQTAPRLPS